VTSDVEGREWHFEGGRIRWVRWETGEQPSGTLSMPRISESGMVEMGAAHEGRLVVDLDEGVDRERAQLVADALSGLVDLVSGPWGMQLTLLELPEHLANHELLYAKEVDERSERHGWMMPPNLAFGTRWALDVGDSLDLLDPVIRDADAGGGLLSALVFLFVSHLEFAFLGEDVEYVLEQGEDEETPESAIDRVRVEESFHNCFKALEALLGGEPPRDGGRLRERLESLGIDADTPEGFEGRAPETMIERIRRMHMTRDKRSAHGGKTGVPSRKITFFELMDAQRATQGALYQAITDILRKSA
jgi:hypothetical protein